MYLGILASVLMCASTAHAGPNPTPNFGTKKINCPPPTTIASCLDENERPDTKTFGAGTGRERVIVNLGHHELTVVDEGHGVARVDDADGREVGRIDVDADFATVTVGDATRDGLLDLLFETEDGDLWTLPQLADDDDIRR